MKKILISLTLLVFGCYQNQQNSNISINDLADIYVDRIITTYPELSYYMDIPLEDHSGHSIPDANTIEKWEAFEDSLYVAIKEIDESTITSKSDRITYWILKEDIESSIQMRVCNKSLWNISHRRGFHHSWARIAGFQPVGDAVSREQALARWSRFPVYVDAEISNLELGLEQGYSMPKEIVELVIDQVDMLAGYTLDDSPYMSPAKRDSTEDFTKAWGALVEGTIIPTLQKFSNYLRNNYLEKARTDVSILSIPSGSECYKAYIRRRTTTNKTGEDIFSHGLEIVNANIRAIEELGMELYELSDFGEIINTINADSTLYFNTSKEILSFNQAIMDTAKVKSKDWFDLMPSKEATLKPYLDHESGIGNYERATENKPAYFRLSLKNPEKQTYHANERLTFHEAYPGHHLQIGIQQDIEGLHEVRKFIGFGSYSEGWGRYSEQLAEEMGLYNYKASMISRRAWPSRGMVADPALHLKRWSKDSVMNYMMQSGMKRANAENLYLRMIDAPAQLTSYDVGGEEIKALRKLAENKLGDAFNIKMFHTKVLENGSIPLSALRSTIEKWIEDELIATSGKKN